MNRDGSDQDVGNVVNRLQSMAITSPTGASINHGSSANYILCDSELHLENLVIHIETVSKASKERIPIFLDCEGRDLGREGGKLGLVQLGIEREVYLIDVIVYPKSLDTLKNILEDPSLVKIVWDGRSDYCELLFGHGIALGPLIDLQLLRVYESCGGVARLPGNYITLEGMGRTFENAPAAIRRDSGIDMLTFLHVQGKVKGKHGRDDTEFWVRRPIDSDCLDYAAYDVLQLRSLYTHFQYEISKRPHIATESKRYAEMFPDQRRPKNSFYVDHGVLPQEILERSADQKAANDKLGTRTCGGCRRDLHQDSFQYPFEMAWNDYLCYTCFEVKRYKGRKRK